MQTSESPQLDLPARSKTSEGKMRRVGVEVEFGGMKLDNIVNKSANASAGKSKNKATTWRR